MYLSGLVLDLLGGHSPVRAVTVRGHSVPAQIDEPRTHWGRRQEAAEGRTLLSRLPASSVSRRKVRAPGRLAHQLKNTRVLTLYFCQMFMSL